MVGAMDSVAQPNVVLNTIVAEAFKDAKYIYQFPDLKYNIPMTPNYQLREVIMPRNLESSQSKIITKETDKEIWVTKLYYCLINVVSTKLTKQEIEEVENKAKNYLNGIFRILHF